VAPGVDGGSRREAVRAAAPPFTPSPRAPAAHPAPPPPLQPPAHLDGSLPGDYGFDPLRLGEQPDALKWYVQAELQHGRWAMLGAAGVLGKDLLGAAGVAGPAARVPWYEAGAFTYFAPAKSLFIAQLFLFAFVEARRYADYQKPGSVNDDPIFKGNKLPAG